MLAQRFHLQPLLSYKQNLEDLQQIELAQLKAACAREEEELRRLEELQQEAARHLRTYEAESQLNLELIKLAFKFLESLRERIARQSEVVAQLVDQVETKRQQLVKTMQERRVLEKLKERYLAEIEEQNRRQEMRLNDEVGTALHHKASRDQQATEEDQERAL